MKFLCLAVVLAFLGCLSGAQAEKKLVCYYASWSQYRSGVGHFSIEDINPFICTHLIYTSIDMNDDGTIKVNEEQDLIDGKAGFFRFNELKKINPSLKTMVSIGGWVAGSVKFSEAFNDPEKREVFVEDSVRFLIEHGFDGLDLDWEFPAQRGGIPSDVAAFTALIKSLRIAFDKHGFILSAAVPALEQSFLQSYDVPALAKYLDFINVMAFDFHGPWESKTGHHSPLYVSEIERETALETFNANAGIKAWLQHGGIREKLILGIGLYGRTFTLNSFACKSPRCPAIGFGKAGEFSGEPGVLAYHEICQLEKGGNKFWDIEAKVPYMAYGEDQWVTYDDEESARHKVEYINLNDLGGAMVFSVDYDDFRGLCGKGQYPFLSALKESLHTTPAVKPPTAIEPLPKVPSAPKVQIEININA